MATIIADRVRDTTTSISSPFGLSGTAPLKYRTFSAAPMSIGDTTFAFFRHQTANQWQVAGVTYSALNQLTLGTVYASSNAGAAVTFSAGTIDVVLDIPAAKRVLTDLTQTLSNKILINSTLGNIAAPGDANYTILSSDGYVVTSTLSAPRTWTLPSAAALAGGLKVTIADRTGVITATNTLTIDGNGSETIDGALTYVMRAPYSSVTLQTDYTGAAWKVVDQVAVAAEDLLAVGTFSGVASLEFDLRPYVGRQYSSYKVRLDRVFGSDLNAEIYMRTSTTGGAPYDTGASAYYWQYLFASTTAQIGANFATTNIDVGWLTNTGGLCNIEIICIQPRQTGNDFLVNIRGNAAGSAGPNVHIGVGSRQTAADVDAIQFYPGTGTFGGAYSLYGMR